MCVRSRTCVLGHTFSAPAVCKSVSPVASYLPRASRAARQERLGPSQAFPGHAHSHVHACDLLDRSGQRPRRGRVPLISLSPPSLLPISSLGTHPEPPPAPGAASPHPRITQHHGLSAGALGWHPRALQLGQRPTNQQGRSFPLFQRQENEVRKHFITRKGKNLKTKGDHFT